MKIMNETRAVVKLRELMNNPHGWGRDQGREVFQLLIQKVEANPGKLIIEVSLEGIERNDISFASETVVELAKRYRGNKGFCLSHVADVDLLENWEAAAAKKGQPLMVWDGETGRVIGVQPSQGNAAAFEYMLSKSSVTASEIANALDLQITNASTKLKQLWEQGFLLRRQEIAESGGVEFRYFAIR
jgi:DNA-binding transcriptional ArsR family regulator